MTTTTTVSGTVAPGFEPVRDVFQRQFDDGQHIGASVCVYHGGKPVVDLWGGAFDEEGGRPWARDTMTVVYSTTKGLTATCAHILADRGLLDYDALVSTYWPEFARNGKERVAVRHLLAHQSGVVELPDDLTAQDVVDWDRMVRVMEEVTPAWTPGEASGYHALTFGWLVGELVRRIDGRSVGQFLRDEVCAPLGLRDLHLGAPPEVEARIAPFVTRFDLTPEEQQRREAMMGRQTLAARALSPPFDMAPVLNSPAGHRAQIPAVSAVATARDVARMYACLANYGELEGVRLMSEATVRRMSELQSHRADEVIMTVPIPYALGYWTGGGVITTMGSRTTAFGHPGFGGSIGYADPEIGMSFGFVPNLLTRDLFGGSRSSALADAARACIAAVAS